MCSFMFPLPAPPPPPPPCLPPLFAIMRRIEGNLFLVKSKSRLNFGNEKEHYKNSQRINFPYVKYQAAGFLSKGS